MRSRLLGHAESIDLPAESVRILAELAGAPAPADPPRGPPQLFLAEGLATHPWSRPRWTGRVNHEQAHAILRGLAALPEDLDPDLGAGRGAPVGLATDSTPRR